MRPLLGVGPHVTLQEAGHGELPVTGGAPEAGGHGGGRGHPGGAALRLGSTVSHTGQHESSVCLFLWFSHNDIMG